MNNSGMSNPNPAFVAMQNFREENPLTTAVMTCINPDCFEHLEPMSSVEHSAVCNDCGDTLSIADPRYLKHGHLNRGSYLADLAEQYEVTIDTIEVLADMLGETEDFDGLISSLEDMAG